ncbi:hypothetical protein WKH56_20555 [Priestia sp. SB1]|uniref:hypothetical protein n=1 Tax=Priestia sp. SB1 TaxID=3132359 RepID=UPI00316CA78C
MDVEKFKKWLEDRISDIEKFDIEHVDQKNFLDGSLTVLNEILTQVKEGNF